MVDRVLEIWWRGHEPAGLRPPLFAFFSGSDPLEQGVGSFLATFRPWTATDICPQSLDPSCAVGRRHQKGLFALR